MTETPDSDSQEDAAEVDNGSDLPPMDFSLFLLSLNASALLHLGEAGEVSSTPNLPMARQTIEMIAMLEDKTRGNLSGKEEQLLNQVLFDLRMRYARMRS